jgi:hypothetical protein
VRIRRGRLLGHPHGRINARPDDQRAQLAGLPVQRGVRVLRRDVLEASLRKPLMPLVISGGISTDRRLSIDS